MAFKRLDINEDVFEGYCFVDEDGEQFYVKPANKESGVAELGISDRFIHIYHKDIPMLIKCLEAAYKEVK